MAAKKVVIRPYPKAVFFYPTLITACGIMLYSAAGYEPGKTCGMLFAFVFLFNFLVVALEFTKNLFVNLLIGSFTLAFLLLWLNSVYANLFGRIGQLIQNINIVMNPGFYSFMSFSIGLSFIIVLIEARFEYCEVTSNELIVHTGIFSDVKRYPSPNLRYEQSITDVFENILLRSGKLKFFVSGEKEPIILENVPFIKKKFAVLDDILSRTEVISVAPDQPAAR